MFGHSCDLIISLPMVKIVTLRRKNCRLVEPSGAFSPSSPLRIFRPGASLARKSGCRVDLIVFTGHLHGLIVFTGKL